MNEFEVPSAIQLDRFVDGEMSDQQRRELLESFNREQCSPTCGWRRLALAFVESQTLRQDLRPAIKDTQRPSYWPTAKSETVVIPKQSLTVPNEPKRWRSHAVCGRFATLTICCLMAFGLGRGWNTGRDGMTPPVVMNPVKTFADSPASDKADNQQILAGTPSLTTVHETLHLVMEDLSGRALQSADVPVVNGDEVDATKFLEGPPSIPMSLQRELLRHGRVVREERQLIEMELSDGRRGVMPISNVTVFDAGMDVFQ